MVEFLDYFGPALFSLGIVESIHEEPGTFSRGRLSILTATGRRTNKDPNFIRFRIPQLISNKVQEESFALKYLQNFQATARAILSEHYLKIANELAYLESVKDPLSRENLIYEHDIAKKTFGPNYSLAEVYAVHLYLHSFTDKYGRDGLYNIWNDKVSDIASGGPYFFRTESDLQLIKSLSDTITHTRPIMMDSETAKLDDDLGRCIVKAAICHWHDTPNNPILDTIYRIFPHLDARRPKDTTTLVAKYSLQKHIQNMDLPLAQSGLVFPQVGCNHLDDARENNNFVLKEIPSVKARREYSEECFAIDDANTIEVDDAISFSERAGKQWIHIHVADPGHFLYPGSDGDLMARGRVVTLYTPSQMFPMLPRPVVERCTLSRANLSMTFSATLSSTGDIQDYEVNLGLISRLRQLTYEQADDYLTNNSNDRLHSLKSITDSHYGFRLKQGLVEIDVPKGRARINRSLTSDNHDGHGSDEIEFKLEKKSASHRLVSEAMIIAGRVAALFANERKLSIPFRYHESPCKDEKSEDVVSKLLQKYRANQTSLSFIEKLTILDQFRPSAVDLIPRPHWAMALPVYTKATSPLRRYFDLLLHQQLHAVLSQRKKIDDVFWSNTLPKIYRHEQYLKRLSNASQRFWTLRYMEQLLKSKEPLSVSIIPIHYNIWDGSLQVFFEDFGLRHFCRSIPGASQMTMGMPIKMWLLSVDSLRGEVQVGHPNFG